MSIWWGKTSVNDTLPTYASAKDNSACLLMLIQGLCQKQIPWKKLQDNQTNRQTDKLKGWQTYWQQFRLVKIFANDTLLSCARATDISICLPMHIQGLCQRQEPWRKNRQMKTIRQTDKLTGQRQNLGEKNFKTIRRKAWKKTSSQDEQTNWLSDTYLQMFCIMTGEKKLVLLKKYM